MSRDWSADNHAYLLAQLDRVRAAVERRDPIDGEAAESIAAQMEQPPSLDRVVAAFGLSPFERDVLLLCAGVELDAAFAATVSAAQDGRAGPTFSLALAVLPEAHWSALTPSAALRHWRMIEVGPGEGLVSAPLRIDERILHQLAGVSHIDERLHGVIGAHPAPPDPAPSVAAVAERIAALWRGGWAPVALCGPQDAGAEDVAARAAALSGLELLVLRARDIPHAAPDRELMSRLCDREAGLNGGALLVLVDDSDDDAGLRATAAFVEQAQSPLLVAGREPLRIAGRTLPRFDLAKPGGAEQAALWRAALGPLAERLDGRVEQLVNQFDMAGPAILTASGLVLESVDPEETDAAAALLWDTCRSQSRARLDDMAQRVDAGASWDDLVLPASSLEILHDIVTQVRHRMRVYDDWGFARKSSRGLGISALFSGTSGTGKTLAAEIMASELRLDLYRIDLSQVVSKYIGETEKNLRRVFDAAETAGAVLLFDEADALFGKRSEVKDSHDRYANIEVSYLLQRMEAYRGLAILTTNMKTSLDPAFTRRIRFVLEFPFPDEEHRAEIWRRVFPAQTPVSELDAERLALLNVAGGNIRNIALGAAFLAADDDAAVDMSHVLRAARAEYAKLERPLTGAEIAGWPR